MSTVTAVSRRRRLGWQLFFLVNEHQESIALKNVERLTEVTWAIRRVSMRRGLQDAMGRHRSRRAFGSPDRADADSRNFVLCPGKAYDRSPCGTGTSAKMACLYDDGKLPEGKAWRQESIVGSLFEHVNIVDKTIQPVIRGSAYVNAEATLILDERDPYCWVSVVSVAWTSDPSALAGSSSAILHSPGLKMASWRPIMARGAKHGLWRPSMALWSQAWLVEAKHGLWRQMALWRPSMALWRQAWPCGGQAWLVEANHCLVEANHGLAEANHCLAEANHCLAEATHGLMESIRV